MKKLIQLRPNFLKTHKYQIVGFTNKYSMRTIVEILEETNNCSLKCRS